ncbi:superoxide dismutase family protein [Polyangium spumosum]|uniref:Superoxide dismutase family protein n=1 Tax=Polyangium spumosum TaxID=889282 RepID=A0A6N7PLX5_9BACT|nr:superoxide dismutase family protein [Polyangium spumosum]MRG93152.1 superoxide dismutase family protein [Polyangium spumosum]
MVERHFVLGATLAAALVHAGASRAEAKRAAATLHDAQGKDVGTVSLEETPNGVLIRGELAGLPPGAKGFHIHDKGACTPNFEAAGGHFNPTGAAHGFESKAGPHLGDLPNLHVPANGRVTVEVFARGVTLGEGPTSLVAGDGTAIVVHAGADDYETDPAGAAGARLACGVIRPSAK